MPLRYILTGAQAAAVLAYVLLLARLLRSSRWLSLPLFTAYAALMIVDLVWHPITIREVIWIEPWLLSLRFCLVIEAAVLLSDSMLPARRRWMLLFLIFFGLMGSTRVAGIYSLSDLAGWYRSARQCTHVGLAFVCIAMCLYQAMTREFRWDLRWLTHFRIVSMYMIARAGFSFLARPERDWEYHSTIRIAALVTYSALIAIWLWFDRVELRVRSTTPSGFKHQHPPL